MDGPALGVMLNVKAPVPALDELALVASLDEETPNIDCIAVDPPLGCFAVGV